MIQLQRVLELNPCELLATGRLYRALENAEYIDKVLGVDGTGNSVVAQVQCLLDQLEPLEVQKAILDDLLRAGVKEVEVDKEFRLATDSSLVGAGSRSVSEEIEEIKRKIRKVIGYSASNRLIFAWNDGRLWQ